MHHTKRNKSRPAIRAVLAFALIASCLALAACGGSSSSTATNTSAAATAPSGGTGPTGAGLGRFAALRACLQKQGITLPKRTPGQRPPGGAGGFFGGRAAEQLPNGVTPAQMQAALKKCGGGLGAGLRRINTPALRQALAKFATCMRENGVNVPAPNTSGSGPVFSTKGLNTSSPQFKTAEAKCRADLEGSFRSGGAGGRSAGPPPPGAAPGQAGPGEPSTG